MGFSTFFPKACPVTIQWPENGVNFERHGALRTQGGPLKRTLEVVPYKARVVVWSTK